MATHDHPGDTFRPIAQLDRIVHEPGRLMILALLSIVKKADFLFLEKETGMTRGNLSSHMRKLEEAGYVAVEKTFVEKIPRTLYRITPEGNAAFHEYRHQILGLLGTFPD